MAETIDEFFQRVRALSWSFAERAEGCFFRQSMSWVALLNLADMLNTLLNEVQEANQRVFDLAGGKLAGTLRDLPEWARLEAENETLRKAALQDQQYRFELKAANLQLQKIGKGWREHSKELGKRIAEVDAENIRLRREAREREEEAVEDAT